MRLFVTGTDGYIGSVLAPRLIAEGHEVTGFDTGFYRGGWLFTGSGESLVDLGPNWAPRQHCRAVCYQPNGCNGVATLV